MAEMQDIDFTWTEDDWEIFLNDFNAQQEQQIQTDEEIRTDLDRLFSVTQQTTNTTDTTATAPEEVPGDSSFAGQGAQYGLTQSQTFEESQWMGNVNQSALKDTECFEDYFATISGQPSGSGQQAAPTGQQQQESFASVQQQPLFAGQQQPSFAGQQSNQYPAMDFEPYFGGNWPTKGFHGLPNQENPGKPEGFVRLQPVQPEGSAYRTPYATPFTTPEPRPQEPPFAEPIEYQRLFHSFAEARATIEAEDAQIEMVPLQVQNDNWSTIDIHTSARQLLHATTALPTQTPPVIASVYQKKYWSDHQHQSLLSVQSLIRHSPPRAEARILLLIEAVLHLHQHGCPATILHRKTLKEGYRVETDLRASDRLEAIVEVAREDKYVAHDILTGTNLEDIVRSPKAYMRRKADNCRVNAKKAMEKEEADRSKGVVARRRGAAGGGGGGGGGGGTLMRRKKRGSSSAAMAGAGAGTGAVYATPAPSSPAGFYADLAPIPFGLGAVQESLEERGGQGAERDMQFGFE